MKSKLDRVFSEVLKAVGNNMTKWDAIECACYLLKKHHGNVKLAIQEAKNPFKINGKFTY